MESKEVLRFLRAMGAKPARSFQGPGRSLQGVAAQDRPEPRYLFGIELGEVVGAGGADELRFSAGFFIPQRTPS